MLKVREAVLTDTAALSGLVAELGFSVSAEQAEKNLAALIDRSSAPIVADDGQVLGCVTYNIMPVLHRPAPVGRISMLIVASGSRRRGIGRLLVEAAIERLRSRNCQLCEVTSNLALVEAHAFYERLGFERTSIRLVQKI